MEQYEIRVVRQKDKPAVYTYTYASDYAALRGARELAGADGRLEIWRGIHCIYQDKPGQNPAWRWPSL